MTETHTILGGKVHVYRRPKSSNWQCSTYLAGKNRRRSTKEDSLSKAKEIAEDWYLQLRGQAPHRRNQNGENLPRGIRTVPPRVRHHHRG